MAQLGFFDADKRLEALSAKGDPLEAIDRLVPWESFRAESGTSACRKCWRVIRSDHYGARVEFRR